MTAAAASGTARCLRRMPPVATVSAVAILALAACAATSDRAAAPTAAAEEIYILRSIRERQATEANWCASSRTGFAPFAADAERSFSFWSVGSRPEDGKVTGIAQRRVATLRACFGPTRDRARQNFYAEIALGVIAFRGKGECRALAIDFPETGLFPVRCHLVLSGLPAPYVGGLLTTSTLTSKAAFGGDTEPRGYTQASIATIRLWKAKPHR